VSNSLSSPHFLISANRADPVNRGQAMSERCGRK
jgi:hypothetical protein